jgi:hypothetical protein
MSDAKVKRCEFVALLGGGVTARRRQPSSRRTSERASAMAERTANVQAH